MLLLLELVLWFYFEPMVADHDNFGFVDMNELGLDLVAK
jgi:hypothetical protein